MDSSSPDLLTALDEEGVALDPPADIHLPEQHPETDPVSLLACRPRVVPDQIFYQLPDIPSRFLQIFLTKDSALFTEDYMHLGLFAVGVAAGG